jgi:hypothetical protein
LGPREDLDAFQLLEGPVEAVKLDSFVFAVAEVVPVAFFAQGFQSSLELLDGMYAVVVVLGVAT